MRVAYLCERMDGCRAKAQAISQRLEEAENRQASESKAMKPPPANPYHKPTGHYTPEVAPTPVYKLSVRERFALMFGCKGGSFVTPHIPPPPKP